MGKAKLTPEDYLAADELLEQMDRLLERQLPRDRRDASRESLAELHSRCGDHKFRIRWGMKPALSRADRIEQELILGRLSEQERIERLKELASLPVDEPMLAEHLADVEWRLQAYAAFLQEIVRRAQQQQRGVARWVDDEPALADFVGRLKSNPRFFGVQLASIGSFLQEVRIEKNLGLAERKSYTAESATMLVNVVVSRCIESWQSCCETARRSQTNPSYLYTATASTLFSQSALSGLPTPVELCSLVRLEHTAAIMRLRDRAESQADIEHACEKIVVHAHAAEVTAGSVMVRTGEPDSIEVSPAAANVFQKRGDAWRARFAGGQENILRDGVGAEYLQILLSRPDTDVPALELVRCVNKNYDTCATEEPEEVIDSEAMKSYRTRYRELEDELAIAREHGSPDREEELLTEMGFLYDEIKKFEGLGGNMRKESHHAERARKAVGMAIGRAVGDIAKFDSRLADHLNGPALSRGTSLRYCPERGIRWET